MIKYVKDFEKVEGNEQYAKIFEEIKEAAYEYQQGNTKEELQELCDVVNAVYSRFQQLGMRKHDIQAEMDKHYRKETLRGRKVVEIEGRDYKDNVINQLLETIKFMDRLKAENEMKISILERQIGLLQIVVKANKGEI